MAIIMTVGAGISATAMTWLPGVPAAVRAGLALVGLAGVIWWFYLLIRG